MNLANPLPPIVADATQLRQIVMNLVINASEAIGEETGVVTVTTTSRRCSRDDLHSQWGEEELPEGQYLCLEVADDGCGMDDDTLARLFDPFFTTKFTGRGLGMAAVLGIVRSHKGVIKVHSVPGQGSHFRILLPVSDHPVASSDEEALMCDWRGSGTVLLVDDEEVVREVGTEMLNDLGFAVVTACDGMEALETYREAEGIDLVILDLTMPRMDGEQCLKELKKLNPGVRVILSSGYNELDLVKKIADQDLTDFLPKPYVMEILSETVQRAIHKTA